jgi:pimeloyl-ACP methyl ester carboxylesterase
MRKCARVAGGRRLAYESWGDPNGSPVFLLHGTPGSRRGPRPRSHELALMGIRLVAYDRPGYGLSDRQVGRQVADAAGDVAALADVLGIEQFAVVGRSGGGPHALACAALRPDRVTSAAALVSLAPRFADGLDWFAGMGEANVRDYATAWRASDVPGDAGLLASRLGRFTEDLNRDFVHSVLGAQVPDADRQILADPGIRGLLIENFRQAVADERNLEAVPARGAADDGTTRDAAEAGGAGVRVLLGWLDDTLAFSRSWGFCPEDITVPVLLWHGEDDVILPVEHSRWLAGRIPGATLVTEPGSAHFGALVVLPSVLQWLCRFTPRERSTA